MNDTPTTPAAAAPATPPTEAPTEGAVASTMLDGATPEPKVEGDKPAEKPAEATPFDAEKFEAPEGLVLSDDDKKVVGDLATKHGLSNEAMKDLLTTYADRLKSASSAGEKLVEEQNAKWVDEVKKDPTIGGDKLPQTLATIGKVLDDPAFSDPEFKKVMAYTGAGNNPAVIRTLYKMAQALSEGGHVAGGPPNAGKEKPVPGAGALYPDLPRS